MVSNCNSGFHCYDSGYGCFLNRFQRSGFMLIEAHDCASNDILNVSHQSPTHCTDSCSTEPSCIATTISVNNSCFLKHKCMLPESNSQVFLHIRLRDNRLTCFIGGLNGGHQNTYEFHEKETAIATAIADGKTLVYRQNNIRLKTSQTLQDMKDDYEKTVCFVGNMIKDDSTGLITFQYNHILFDKQQDTCHIFKKQLFKVRFPWPTSNKVESNFKVEIFGQQLFCINDKQTFENKGIHVYTPIDYQVTAEFNGNFVSCSLTAQNSTFCNYSCLCNSVCQAVYIVGYDQFQTMKICEITIF
ncbi:DgyrCDS14966 [Dimorphilus gyrociliatus]|nr:DgyrCDS14966 [Dimorphilus gyrociliatus]